MIPKTCHRPSTQAHTVRSVYPLQRWTGTAPPLHHPQIIGVDSTHFRRTFAYFRETKMPRKCISCSFISAISQEKVPLQQSCAQKGRK